MKLNFSFLNFGLRFCVFLIKFIFFFLFFLVDFYYLQFLPLVLAILLVVAFFTLFERKVLAGLQRRRGPNVVGFLGILQPFADAIKLLTKETIVPSAANSFLFIGAPLFIFALSLFTWAVIPLDYLTVLADLSLGILFVFAISSFGVYGIIISGWASNSKYAFLGGLRSVAQLISYEVSMALVLFPVLIASGPSANLTAFVLAQTWL